MASFYERQGPSSWSNNIVPHFITSNNFIGKAYAKALLGFIADGLRPNATLPIDPNEPLYIIELGTGSGKFSYYFLNYLLSQQDITDFPLSNIRYVMTDFTEKNFNFWKTHPKLKEFFESGQLDAGIFDAENDTEINLWQGNIKIKSNLLKNPIVIVANYLFDTLYHDLFQIKNGELYEGLISTGSKFSEEPDPLDPEIIGRLDNVYKYVKIDENYYHDTDSNNEKYDEHLNAILKWYLNFFKTQDASIIYPIGALRALKKLSKFSNGRMLVLSGDKGNNHTDQFLGLTDPYIAVHGSFSLMVNYHAIGAWFTSQGGFALHNPLKDASLKVSIFILNQENNNNDNEDNFNKFFNSNLDELNLSRSKKHPFLYHAFDEYLKQFSPNDFFMIQKTFKDSLTSSAATTLRGNSSLNLQAIVALIHCSNYDSEMIFKFRDQILEQINTSGSRARDDLINCLDKVYQNFYLLETDKDIAFEIGRIYYAIRDYAKALYYYTISLEVFGKHHVTSYNRGLCFYSLKQLDEAETEFRESVSLSETYLKAKTWLDRVVQEKKLLKELQEKENELQNPTEETSELDQ